MQRVQLKRQRLLKAKGGSSSEILTLENSLNRPRSHIKLELSSSAPELVKEFSNILGELKGETHFVRNEDELKEILGNIVSQNRVKRVVSARIPNQLLPALEEATKGADYSQVEVLKGTQSLDACKNADLGITWADYAIASTGSIVEIVEDDSFKLASSLPFRHVALVPLSHFLKSVPEAVSRVGELLRSSTTKGNKMVPVVSFISGPSKTSDIELIPLHGVHGPNSLYALVLGWL